MLTIFSSPKRFEGHNGLIQRNAIRSWRALGLNIEILLLGNDPGTAEMAHEVRARHIPDIELNSRGTPMIPSLFAVASEVARFETLCYVNADIILAKDLLSAVEEVRSKLTSFLLIGRRIDLDIGEQLEFSGPAYDVSLRERALRHGRLHGPSGLDYFVFPRGTTFPIPSLAVGRPGWDNHLVYLARSSGTPVVDCTKSVLAIHQNHDYSHHAQGRKGVLYGAEARKSWQLTGRGAQLLGTRDATHELVDMALRRVSPLTNPFRKAFTLALLHFHLEWPIRMLRNLRRQMAGWSQLLRFREMD